MSEPTNIAPEAESAPAPDVLVLPSEYFFIEQIEVPPALEASELDDFAELSMEAAAPFPLEQLRWGFLVAPDESSILIYAALHERLKRAGYTELENYIWVLPDFATLNGARFAEAVDVVLECESHSTRFHHPGGEALPEHIRSLSEGDQSNGALRLKAQPVELTEQGTAIFSFESISDKATSGHWTPLEPDEASLWRADVRPSEFKTVERNTRRTTGLITKVTGYAAIFAVFLILLEAFLFIGQFWLGTRESKIEAQSTNVRRVEDKQSLMNKLEQVAQNELRPIDILEAANRIRLTLGSTGIEYDEAVIEGGNRLVIEGKANTINELNAYTETLKKSGNFQLIGSPKSITRSGKTTFTVTLDYIHIVEAPETAPETEDATSETEG